VTRVVPDPEYGPSRCRDCGNAIVWALTDSGRRLPVDFEPSPQGTLELFTEHFPDGSPVDPGVQRVRHRPSSRPPSAPAWLTHWATCPARERKPLRNYSLPADLIAKVEAARERKFGPLFSFSRFWGKA
jgi:hypothetical protein